MFLSISNANPLPFHLFFFHHWFCYLQSHKGVIFSISIMFWDTEHWNHCTFSLVLLTLACLDIVIVTEFIIKDFFVIFIFKACLKCCRYFKTIIPELRNALDGKNLEVVLTELGTRFQKILLDHLYQFTFSDVGRLLFERFSKDLRHV